MAKYSQQLLVEGNDDLHVISSLCEKFEIKESFKIIDCKGIDKLLETIFSFNLRQKLTRR